MFIHVHTMGTMPDTLLELSMHTSHWVLCGDMYINTHTHTHTHYIDRYKFQTWIQTVKKWFTLVSVWYLCSLTPPSNRHCIFLYLMLSSPCSGYVHWGKEVGRREYIAAAFRHWKESCDVWVSYRQTVLFTIFKTKTSSFPSAMDHFTQIIYVSSGFQPEEAMPSAAHWCTDWYWTRLVLDLSLCYYICPLISWTLECYDS